MPTLPDSLARLRLFRQSFEDGEICEESGLTTADVDMVLSVLELNEVEELRAELTATSAALDRLTAAGAKLVDEAKRVGADPGIPVYRYPEAMAEFVDYVPEEKVDPENCSHIGNVTHPLHYLMLRDGGVSCSRCGKHLDAMPEGAGKPGISFVFSGLSTPKP